MYSEGQQGHNMNRLLLAGASFTLLIFAGCGGSTSPGQSQSTPSNSIAGQWNVALTDAQNTAQPKFTFAISISQSGSVITGTSVGVPYSGGTGYGETCFNAGNLTVNQGTVSGTSVALVITDPGAGSSSQNTLNMQGSFANNTNVTGTFGLNANAPGHAVGDAHPKLTIPVSCDAVQGTFSMTRQ